MIVPVIPSPDLSRFIAEVCISAATGPDDLDYLGQMGHFLSLSLGYLGQYIVIWVSEKISIL